MSNYKDMKDYIEQSMGTELTPLQLVRISINMSMAPDLDLTGILKDKKIIADVDMTRLYQFGDVAISCLQNTDSKTSNEIYQECQKMIQSQNIGGR